MNDDFNVGDTIRCAISSYGITIGRLYTICEEGNSVIVIKNNFDVKGVYPKILFEKVKSSSQNPYTKRQKAISKIL